MDSLTGCFKMSYNLDDLDFTTHHSVTNDGADRGEVPSGYCIKHSRKGSRLFIHKWIKHNMYFKGQKRHLHENNSLLWWWKAWFGHISLTGYIVSMGEDENNTLV